jgi:hypothetical protein
MLARTASSNPHGRYHQSRTAGAFVKTGAIKARGNWIYSPPKKYRVTRKEDAVLSWANLAIGGKNKGI